LGEKWTKRKERGEKKKRKGNSHHHIHPFNPWGGGGKKKQGTGDGIGKVFMEKGKKEMRDPYVYWLWGKGRKGPGKDLKREGRKREKKSTLTRKHSSSPWADIQRGKRVTWGKSHALRKKGGCTGLPIHNQMRKKKAKAGGERRGFQNSNEKRSLSKERRKKGGEGERNIGPGLICRQSSLKRGKKESIHKL